jgi:predicted RND superfamily exporter protein
MDALPAACHLPTRHPKATLAVLALVTAALGAGALRTTFDPSTESVFPEGHPAVETFAEFRQVFGADEAIYLAFEVAAGDVFSRESITLCRELRAALEAIEGVEQVYSLADVPVLSLNPMGLPTLEPGLPEDLDAVDDAALAAWRGRVLATPFVVGSLVSPDRRATSLVVEAARLPPGPEGAVINQQMVRAIRDLIGAEEADSLRFSMAGSPVIKAQIMESIVSDMITFSGPLLLLAAVTAFFVLRSWRGVALVLLVLGVTNAWVLGGMGYLGISFHSMTSLVPTLILVIGVADSLHLLVEQRAQGHLLGPGVSGADTVRAALDHVFMPCLLTSVTTALGFGSLLSSDVRPIRDFGAASAVGALVALVVTVTLVPAFAALSPGSSQAPGRAPRLDGLGRFVTSRRWLGLALAPVVLGLGIAGALRVEPNTDFLRFFPADTRMVLDAERIQALFGGVAPCEMIVVGPPDASHDPAALQGIDAFQRALEADVLIDRTYSLVDFLSAAMQMGGDERRLPETRADVVRLEGIIRAVAGGRLPLERLVSADSPAHAGEEWLRITVRAQAVGSARFSALLTRVEELEAEHLLPAGLSVRPTGTTVVFSETADTIMMGQVRGFLWAFATISAVMVLALRSLTLGLVSLLPNLIPIAAILGSMGWLGIPLNSFNSMVVSVAIGIAVDDTIHILVGFKRFSVGRQVRAAIEETVAHEGAAVVSTSVVLLAGFGVLLVASFLPTQHFGLLTAISIGAALLGDLVILPAILLVVPWRCPLDQKLGGADVTGDEAADG